MPRALVSVHNKDGLIPFARRLLDAGWSLVASGGTERALRDAGIEVTPIEQVTGLVEMLDGRVKTLHPAIHAGILARDNAVDMETLRAHGYTPINMVVCNLYPFQETVAEPGIALQDAVEQIDIGGVALLRAGAKNFLRVVTICDPADYERIITAIENERDVSLALRRELAVKAFATTRDYDTAIHGFLSQDFTPASFSETLPQHLSIGYQQTLPLRYGENPHQEGAFYTRRGQGILGGTVLGGKQLSYNNILDLDAAWRTVSSFDLPCVVIVKHLTPTGVAVASSITDAFPLALASDPVSSFGGVIAVNRPVDEAFYHGLGGIFVEAIIAPSFTQEAQVLFTEKRSNCRLLQTSVFYDGAQFEVRSVHRGLLVQQVDLGDPEMTAFEVVSARRPTDHETAAMAFAWKVVSHVKSNAIVLVQDQTTVGVGGGLPSRVDAVKIAIGKAGDRAAGSVLASDAFFPFADGVEAAIVAGVTAIIQPGGSVRDKEVIAAADAAGVAMIFTRIRHFRH